jgi:hypothetical protein
MISQELKQYINKKFYGGNFMKQKKFIIIVIFMFSIIAYGVIIDSNENEQTTTSKDDTKKHVSLHAKTDHYESLASVESSSDLIISGKKIGEHEPTILTDDDGNLLALYTLSQFEIESIENNNSQNKLKVGDVIDILENEAFNAEENIIYHIAGYSKMILDNRYMLFLEYSNNDKWYIPLGVTAGKIPFESNEPIMFTDDSENLNDFDCGDNSRVENAEKIRGSVQKKYKNLLKNK